MRISGPCGELWRDMERLMPTWILIIALLSIAATALLTSILTRVNAPPRRDKGSDGGDAGSVSTGSSSRGDRTDNDGTGDGGSDGGGGDGGGD
jgi:uncharacterized membrane protein YgcG